MSYISDLCNLYMYFTVKRNQLVSHVFSRIPPSCAQYFRYANRLPKEPVGRVEIAFSLSTIAKRNYRTHPENYSTDALLQPYPLYIHTLTYVDTHSHTTHFPMVSTIIE